MSQSEDNRFKRASGPFIIIEVGEGGGQGRWVVMNSCAEEKSGSGTDIESGL